MVAYAGSANPDIKDDFDIVGFAKEVAVWKNYAYTSDLTIGSNGEAWIGIGISVRWETYLTYYIDDVRIDSPDINFEEY